MESLYKLQMVCFVFMLMNAMALALTRLHVRWVNVRYEFSRWMICASMLLMGIQYLLQMAFGIRASGDDKGAVVNILFYTPCFAMFAVAIYNIVAKRRRMLRFLSGNIVLYTLIVAVCVGVYLKEGSLCMGSWIYVLLILFMMSLTHSIAIVINEIRKRGKVLEEETSVDMVTYVRYARSSIAVLFSAAYVVPCTILSSSLLLLFGPLVLFAVFFFVITFVSLGYNNAPTEQLISSDDDVPAEDTEDADGRGGEDGALPLSEERMGEIRQRLDDWCAGMGYKDCGTNMVSLSRDVKVPKKQLSIYFEKGLHCTFRVWLSDMRFKAAQAMMLEHPDYSNDVISSECGFSSRSYLYRIFKERLGETPTEWRAGHGGGNS